MASLRCVLPIPSCTTFELWSSVLISQLARYNIVKCPSEAGWKVWATTVVNTPALKSQGLPAPDLFTSWQDWAVRVNEALR